MKFYGKTDTGVVRYENQDCFGIYSLLPGLTLCVICDGMGGNAGGAIASRIAIDTFADSMRDRIIPDFPDDAPDLSDRSIRRALAGAVSAANEAVLERADESGGKLNGMGTTLVGVLLSENGISYSVNVGDSRLYCITEEKITQLTRDHSLVQQFIEQGSLTYEQARTSSVRHIITRAVGIGEEINCDIQAVDISGFTGKRPGWLLLCSDGLSGCVSDKEMGSIIRTGKDLKATAERLVRAAREAGGPDNITVIIIKLN